MPTIRELYPRAVCHECEWEGPREDMKDGDGPLDELCPVCGSGDTEWVPANQQQEQP